MLSREDNDILTRVGPGTAMGNLMREFWMPGALAPELPEPDGAPLRVRLLGENLIVWRNTSGGMGAMQESCPHRGASMFFGRNEEEGLRCVYHGWKFDVTGACIDMPNEPAESNFKHKIHATAYPVRERNGVLWFYMGPRTAPPELPDLEANMQDDGNWSAQATLQECNYMQVLEGDIDTSHASFLHVGALDEKDIKPGTFTYYMLKDRSPRYEVLTTECGTMYGAFRPAEDDSYYWRIAAFLFPCFTMTPTGVLGLEVRVGCRVPMDDDHTLSFSMRRGTNVNATGTFRTQNLQMMNVRADLLPQETGWYGRFRSRANRSNDYEINREAQKTISYSGINGVQLQDIAVTESMGHIYNRIQEHLGTSDMMIIRTRKRLIDAAKAHRDYGTLPPSVDDPTLYGVRTGGTVLPRTANWIEATAGYRTGFKEHAGLTADVLGGTAG